MKYWSEIKFWSEIIFTRKFWNANTDQKTNSDQKFRELFKQKTQQKKKHKILWVFIEKKHKIFWVFIEKKHKIFRVFIEKNPKFWLWVFIIIIVGVFRSVNKKPKKDPNFSLKIEKKKSTYDCPENLTLGLWDLNSLYKW